ncbi:3-dehydrosphinganine reductase [Tyrophagus putrescentiae]|nr:3-dehydrosphinganine reductase [Tyrophagus putrescentiae]
MNSPIGRRVAHRFNGSVFGIPKTCNVCKKQMVLGYKCRDCKSYFHAECVRQAPDTCLLLEQSLLEVVNQSFSDAKNGYNYNNSIGKSTDTFRSFINSSATLTSTQSSLSSIFWAVLESDHDGTRPTSPASPITKTFGEIGDQQADTSSRPKSLISREWNIPFDELHFEQPIGGSSSSSGSVGTVFRGTWHGSVAIRLLKTTPSSRATASVRQELAQFESFRQAVATYRKIRHDNLVLFMGASARPPHHFAIVTALCKGNTLHHHVHISQDINFNVKRIVSICKQLCQGMGYLHSRSITHKDLRSKNVFLENGTTVIITDYSGLAASPFIQLTKGKTINHSNYGLPVGRLLYLAPEIMRSLCFRHRGSSTPNLPYSFASDVFAFGTILFELLFAMMPFGGQPAEAIIWRVGRGVKPAMGQLRSGRDVKDLLVQCWSFDAHSRPDFCRELPERLERLPRLMQRAPSHPVMIDRLLSSDDLLG